ncbi:type I-E CRISPR-associated protein Cas6/Cse3/CasE [Pseudodonghicola flavimaris]|uniref:Type I-E CRISPR-associated protein Cas6/Cse3/CasE n=1 Tax=Pseudodonghicola flavimaris TaxID=3050036 RepID=A0ABT7EVU6_9RHOB|nr:type I-E CRISPR-associated protein Cas6/Cse3/CasE [Pseudodonghicola flavimaris]MDK3016474.1 type I-E CRISPR-associated protein Cas6/Cse3/CasE [Pseudodonghicola flavimaris]
MSLHLIELPLDLAALNRWAGARGIGRQGFDEGLALHHLLGEVFGPAVLQPFRLMVAPRARSGTLYGYADRGADGLRSAAAPVIGPSEAGVIRLDRLRSVPRPAATWSEGMRLGFDVRLRPVVRLASAIGGEGAGFAKGAELDAFLAETLRLGTARPRETVYLDWLSARLAGVAELEPETSRMASFRRLRSRRGGKRVEGPEITVHGTLRIADPAGFADLLARGVGRHRAYGYGMLLLRPPQRRN